MDSEDLTATDPPTSIDPYAVLSIPTNASPAEIKSAYKKLALRTHPDKAAPAQREAAHKAFQEVALAYAVLSDSRRRARYDRTGSTAETLEDDEDFNWADFFRAQFAEHVTADKINELKREYQGSEEERGDVLKAYRKGKGSFGRVMQEIMLSNVLDDEARFRGWIEEAIERGEVEAFEKYTGESERRKEARRKVAREEAEEAEEAAKELGVHDRLYGNGEVDGEGDGGAEVGAKGGKKGKKASGNVKKKAKESDFDLAAMIQKRHAGSAARSEAFFENLEAKYAGGSKGKKRKVDEPNEEAFAAMDKKLKASKKKKAAKEDVDDEEEEVEVAPLRQSRSRRKKSKA